MYPSWDIRPWGICKAFLIGRAQEAWHVLRGEALEKGSQLGPARVGLAPPQQSAALARNSYVTFPSSPSDS